MARSILRLGTLPKEDQEYGMTSTTGILSGLLLLLLGAGALFAHAHGTDPELLIIIEAIRIESAYQCH